MYYEEKWIDGVLHYRTNPRDQFRPIENMEKWVNDHFAAFREQIDATPPAGAGEAVAVEDFYAQTVIMKAGPVKLAGHTDAVGEAIKCLRITHNGYALEHFQKLAAPTPLPEAVLSLPEKWRADASKTIGKGGCVTTLDAAALTRCADELGVALRAIGGGGNE